MKNGVKNIQAATYNGACTVDEAKSTNVECILQDQICHCYHKTRKNKDKIIPKCERPQNNSEVNLEPNRQNAVSFGIFYSIAFLFFFR